MRSFSQLEEILASFTPKLEDVSGAMIVTLDGRILVNAEVTTKPSQVAAMTSSSLALATRICETINAGQLNEVTVSGSDGSILLYAVGQKAVLVVITKKSPNIALINWEARKVICEMISLFN